MTDEPEDLAIDYAERIKSLSESFTSQKGRDCWNAAELIVWLLSEDEPRKDKAVNSLRAALAKDIIDAAYKHAMQVINEAICVNGSQQPIVGPRLVSQYNANLSLSTPCSPEQSA